MGGRLVGLKKYPDFNIDYYHGKSLQTAKAQNSSGINRTGYFSLFIINILLIYYYYLIINRKHRREDIVLCFT